MSSIQLFVYGINGFNRNNNFPLIYFNTNIEMHDFIQGLQSVSRQELDPDTPYFVVNNPQLLPSDIRKLHVYENPHYTTDSRSDADEASKIIVKEPRFIDGVFPLIDNIQHLKNYKYDNNTSQDKGFDDYIQTM